MTTKTRHVVVDGSNIATEGRSLPSLAQLNEAVLAFLDEFPESTVTVVVDATFGHRIHKSEVKEFDSAVANNELVAPPAGAVGRGDAFVLGIAHKAQATVLSNDSFQEFHGDYQWLFDEGRLIGGKPVPNVGWVFVERTPVRGPVSRKAVREGKGDAKRGGRTRTRAATKASKEASQPMPVPSKPPPTRGSANGAPTAVEPDAVADAGERTDETSSTPPTSRDMVNDLMPFLEFVEHHPVGTSVNAVVDSYASHGAYVRIGDVLAYVPLRLMDDPPPRSARQAMKIGDAVTLVVAAFAPARRSIDCAVPHLAVDLEPQETAAVIEQTEGVDTLEPDAVPGRSGRRSGQASSRRSRRRGGGRAEVSEAPDTGTTSAESPRPADESMRDPSEAAAAAVNDERAPAAPQTASAKKAAAAKTAARKPAAKKAPAKKTAAKKSAATKSAAKKAPARKSEAKETTVAELPAAKKPAGKKAPAKKAPAKKSPAKTDARKTAATHSPGRKAAAKKAAAKKAAAKKTAAKKTAAKKAPVKKAAVKKAPVKKAAAKKAPASPRVSKKTAASTAAATTSGASRAGSRRGEAGRQASSESAT